MKNFPIEYEDGKTYWISRHTVVGMFVFAFRYNPSGNDEWYVLANKRGSGMPNNVGKWNCPGGFVDYDETTKAAACRECYEETGVSPEKFGDVKFYSFNDTPTGSQNISYKYYCKTYWSEIQYAELTDKYSEHNEVSDIRWINIKDLKKYDWAFNHYNNIMDIYNKRINPSTWQKFKNWLHDLTA